MRLTQQLLAFSRRHVLAPKVVNLNDGATDKQRRLSPLSVEHIDVCIDVASVQGEGIIFKIYLPRADRTVDPATAPRSEQAPPGSGTILLVEDDAGVRRMTRMILERSGYTVLEASNGMEALQIARQDR